MPTTRQYVRRPHRSRLTSDQELCLWMGEGPLGNPQPFASPAARKDAWERHKHRLIGTLPGSAGRRPMAWWQYDAAIRWPGYDAERSTLWRAGLLLGDDERAALEAEWRREFDVAKRLPAGERRAQHYAWADIPEELVRRWTTPAATKKKPRLQTGAKLDG
jgi:hypothetical protein